MPDATTKRIGTVRIEETTAIHIQPIRSIPPRTTDSIAIRVGEFHGVIPTNGQAIGQMIVRMTEIEFAPRGEDAIVVVVVVVVVAKEEGRLAGPLVGRDRESELAFVSSASRPRVAR